MICLTLRPARDDRDYSVLFPSKPNTGITFLCYEDILICPEIRDARHQSFSASTQSSQTRHARPKKMDFMGSYSPPSKPSDHATTISLNPPDCATSISRLITNGMNGRQIYIKIIGLYISLL